MLMAPEASRAPVTSVRMSNRYLRKRRPRWVRRTLVVAASPRGSVAIALGVCRAYCRVCDGGALVGSPRRRPRRNAGPLQAAGNNGIAPKAPSGLRQNGAPAALLGLRISQAIRCAERLAFITVWRATHM